MASFLALVGFLSNAQAADQLQYCDIPVYVNVEGVPNELYRTYTQGIWKAVLTWNKSDAPFNLRAVDWDFKGDRREGAIVFTYGDPDPTNKNIIGNTYLLNDGGTSMTRRARVIISNKDAYCHDDVQINCYNMFNVIVHEFGHALGLPHNPNDSSVMYYGTPIGAFPDNNLHIEDFAAVQREFPSDGGGCAGSEESLSWSKL